MNEGVHLAVHTAHQVDAPEVSRLQMDCYPLPTSVVEGLAEHIKASIVAYLTEQRVTNGTVTELRTQ